MGRCPLVLAVLVAVVAASIAAPAVAGPSAADEQPAPATAQPRGSQGSERAPVDPVLRRRVAAEGELPVLVSLVSPWRAEGGLHEAERGRQRAGIAEVRRTLVRELPPGSFRVHHEYETLPLLSVTVTPEALEALASSPHVDVVTEDEPFAVSMARSVPLINADDAWAAGYSGAGTTVAVLDTGVQTDHPFLAGKTVEEACYSVHGNCPNGATSMVGAGAARPCTYATSCTHGTHVAGTAVGKGATFSGVARDAKLFPVQVFSRFTGAACVKARVDPCALSNSGDQIAGLERVLLRRAAHNIVSVNISIGGGEFPAHCDGHHGGNYKRAIDNLASFGVATIIASGNDGFKNAMGAPACISSAISVGNSVVNDRYLAVDTVNPTSNSTSFLTLLAPGTWIWSSVPGSDFGWSSGTSMAAPHVAGAWAVLRQKATSASVTAIRDILQRTGKPITDSNGITKARIDVNAAVNAIGGLCPPDDAYEPNETSATLVQTGTGYAGIACADNVDWFVLPVSGGSTLTVHLDFTHVAGDLDMELWSSTTKLVSATSSDDDEVISYTVPTGADGNYFVKVYGYNNAQNRYTLQVGTSRCPPDDQYENNDSLAQAEPLTSGTPISGIVCDADVFSITATAGSTIDAELSFVHADGDADLYLYDSSGTELARAVSTTDDEFLSHKVASAGTYYLWVHGYRGAQNAYVLTATTRTSICPPDDAYEPNETSATPLANGAEISAMACNANVDWYAVHAYANSTLTVDLDFVHADGDVDVQLWDATTELARSESETDDERIVRSLASAGTYYLRVYGYDGAQNSYGMSVVTTPNNDPFAAGQVLSGSVGTIVASNDGATRQSGEPQHHGNTGGASIWYRWTAPADGRLTVDTLGSNFDTLLAIYQGSILSGLTALASNDDSTSSTTASEIGDLAVTGGTTYHIAVDGYLSPVAGGPPSRGELELSWSFSPPDSVPGAPTGVSASAGDGSATVSWSPPASEGSSPVTGYLVTSSPGDQTATVDGAARSAMLSGLSNGTSYTFTVHAINAVGTGPGSGSNAVTPTGSATAPGVPRDVAATAGDAWAEVSWSAPSSDGGSPITGYRVTSSPGGKTVEVGGSARTATISGLSNGTSYTFTVSSINAVGTGAGATSPSVWPGVRLDGDPATTERLDQGSPTVAAVELSKGRFPSDGAAHVVLSRDDTFPDSLAGAALTDRGPLLFTATSALPQATSAEIDRALPGGATIYLLGGTGAISSAVESGLQTRGYRVVRLAGPSRVETALAVADEVRRLHPGKTQVALARAYGVAGNETAGWADSVTGGAWAANAGVPVVVTHTDALHDAVRTWLAARGITSTVLLGGLGALSQNVADAAPGPRRISGAARDVTAAEIARRLWGTPTTGQRRFIILNGYRADGWSYGLAAAGYAADADAPILVVHPDFTPDPTLELVATCGAPQVDLLLAGSTAIVTATHESQLHHADGSTC